MGSDEESVPDIPEIDFSNYIRDPNTYDPVIYIHKSLVPHANKGKEEYNNKQSDKCLQFDQQPHTDYRPQGTVKDPLVEQTIKFAKDIIPLTIPPTSSEPVCYTIKSKKCHKRRKHDCCHKQEITYEKEKTNSPEQKNTHSFSERESLSRTSHNNTLDDIQEHRSLCCSSESSDKPNLKRERFLSKCKQNDVQMITSESFEALAENLNSSGDAKIKIHLMNEKDKGLLFESIRIPVIKAIQECIQETHNTKETNSALHNIEQNVHNNSQKLDYLLEKLTSIEKKLELVNDGVRMPKISKLEELERDVTIRESNSEEELAQVHFSRRKSRQTVSSVQEDTEKETVRKLDRGEIPSPYQSSSQLNARNINQRQPARFCWTDVEK